MRAIISALLICLVFAGCRNLSQPITVNLPDGPPQLVVECYLEPDSLYRVFLTETVSYFSAPTNIPLIANATVTITVNGTTVPLTYHAPGDAGNQYVFGEYRSTTRVPNDQSAVFTLNIAHPDGRTITGKTQLTTGVPIDVVTINWDNRKKAQIYAEWANPDPSKLNYYRMIFDKGKPDSTVSVIRNDLIRQGAPRDFAFTDFRYIKNDSVSIRVYRVRKEYYDYYRSVTGAINANLNPFSQPQNIISNVQGGIGIFTGLFQTQKSVKVPAPPS